MALDIYRTEWRTAIPLDVLDAIEERAEWSAAFINDLPDSAFAFIEPGGEKDEDGKTTPRSKRHFPHHDSDGSVDMPHLRNALSRVPQSPHGDKALPHLKQHAKAEGMGEMGEMSYGVDVERRAYDVEWRLADDNGPRITGHAAVFNQPSLPLNAFGVKIQERIAPGAFRKTIREADIRFLFNHDPNFVLGRNKAGTLTLHEDHHGLAIEATPPDTQTIRDLVLEPMRRGDLTGMSFGFQTVKDRYDEDRTTGEVTRTQLEVKLLDVSVVTFPAYPQTDAAVRSIWDGLGIDYERVTSTLLRRRAGQPLDCEDGACLRQAIAVLTEHLPPEPSIAHSVPLSLLRARLDLAAVT